MNNVLSDTVKTAPVVNNLEKTIKTVQTRNTDLVIRITDWLKDKDEPGYDVECYIKGVYDWNESECFTLHSGLTPEQAKQRAIAFAQAQIAKLL